jgi:hypothetical protein
VDLPTPSPPSKVMNLPGVMASQPGAWLHRLRSLSLSSLELA